MTFSNQISAYKFPFTLNENNLTLPEYFKTNLDYQISFEKVITTNNFIYSTCSLTLSKEDYPIFIDYIYNKIEKSKLKFYLDLLVFGKLKSVVADITSNISISYRNHKYEISFEVVIYSKVNFS